MFAEAAALLRPVPLEMVVASVIVHGVEDLLVQRFTSRTGERKRVAFFSFLLRGLAPAAKRDFA